MYALNGVRWVVALGCAAVLTACSPRGPQEGEWYSPWDLNGGCLSPMPGLQRVDARGEAADFCASVQPDRWIWVVYGAPWCSSSLNQTGRMAPFAQRGGDRVRVYAVLTSGPEPLTVPQLRDARAWVSQTGLPVQQVLFDPHESDPRTVPQHLLIGPDGRTWWRWVGALSVDDMLARLDAFDSGQLGLQARPLPALR